MEIPKYGVYYKNFLIVNNEFDVVKITYKEDLEEEYQTDMLIWVDPTNRSVNLEINPNKPLPENDIILKIDQDIDELIPEGQYDLYPIFYLNETPFIISRLAWENYINIFYIEETLMPEDCVKMTSTKKRINGKLVGDDTIYILLRGGYIPVDDINTGTKVQKLDELELITFLCNTKIIYPLSNTINKFNYTALMFNRLNSNKVVSHNDKVFGREEEEIYLDGAHYAHHFIETLKEAYKEIHFFNTPSDWGKGVNWKTYGEDNKTSYNEWIRYTVGFEDFSNSRREFFQNAGLVMVHVNLPIEFEYACTDTELFRQRRLDLVADQFLSYHANDSIKLDVDLLGDGSFALGYSIIWNKDEMMNIQDQIQRRNSSSLEGVDLSVHSMRFNCTLQFHVIRNLNKITPILQGILNIVPDDPNHIKEQNYVSKFEATEEQKKYILEKYAKGEFLAEGEIESLKN